MEKTFSVIDISLYKEDKDKDFAIAKLYFLSDGNNKHNNPISEEVLREYSQTALGKFIVGRFDDWSQDLLEHEKGKSLSESQVILGYIPKDSEITFEKKDGKLFAVCEAVLSKLYAVNVYELFKRDNGRSVSSEFTCFCEQDENEPSFVKGSYNPIKKFCIHGITILGKKFNPSCKGAGISIKQFSEVQADKYYQEKKGSDIDMTVKTKELPVEEKTLAEPIIEKELVEPLVEKTLVETTKEEEKEEPIVEKEMEAPIVEDEEVKELVCEIEAEKEMGYDEATKTLSKEFSDCEDKFEKYLSVVKQLSVVQAENETLKVFKAEKDDEVKTLEVVKIMSAVKEDITVEEFETFKTEGLTKQFAELGIWANTVKAFAYEASKSNPKVKIETKVEAKEEDEKILTFAIVDEPYKNEPKTVAELCKQYNSR